MDDATFNRKHQFARLFVQSASLALVLSSVSHLFQCRLCEASSIDKSACKDQEFLIVSGRSCRDVFVSERKNPRDIDVSEGVTKPYKEGLMMAVYRVSDYFKVQFGKSGNKWKCPVLHAYYACDYCGTFFRSSKAHETQVSSCGCMRLSKRNKTLYGYSTVRLHVASRKVINAWSDMIRRCENENNKFFKDYGQRGIKVCDRWKDFDKFLEDMGEPSPGMSIERIDCNGDYCKENCKWATAKEQQRNTRRNRMLTIGGVTKCVPEWSEEEGAASQRNIHNRLHMGWSDEEAVFGRNACRTA